MPALMFQCVWAPEHVVECHSGQLTSLNRLLILPYVDSLKDLKHRNLKLLPADYHAASIGEPPSGPASGAPFMPSGSSLYRYCASESSASVRCLLRHRRHAGLAQHAQPRLRGDEGTEQLTSSDSRAHLVGVVHQVLRGPLHVQEQGVRAAHVLHAHLRCLPARTQDVQSSTTLDAHIVQGNCSTADILLIKCPDRRLGSV